MRLTESKLKQLIKETLNEMMIKPTPPKGLSPDQLEKIHSLIDSNDPKMIKQARSLVDAILGSSKYVDDYMDYQEPAHVERTAAMVNRATDLHSDDPDAHKKDPIFDYLREREKFLAKEMSRGSSYEEAAKKWNDRMGPLLKEGIIQQMEAEKILRDEFFRVKELKAQGKATDEEVSKAYQDMTNLDTDQFYTDEELASFEAEKAEREQRYQAQLDQEFEDERLAKQRLDQDRNAALKMRPGYADRGIGMGPDDPGDVDDIYPDLREGLMYEGDDSVLAMFENATLEEGGNVCGACLFEQLQEASCGCPDLMGEAEYQGRKVTLNKPTRGDVKKFKVYVKDPKTGNVKKVNFGDPNMKIKKSNPKRRKSFRARHNCDNPGPKTKARYWSCKKW